MTTATDIDIAALVGDMPAPPCESHGHGLPAESRIHSGAATYYAHAHCPCCGWEVVKAYCEAFTAFIVSGGIIRCSQCAGIYPAFRNITILGPVNA